MREIYIGLMSGTSCDAIDAALVDFSDGKIQLLHTYTYPIPPEIKQAIKSCNYISDNEINKIGHLDVHLGELFANACLLLIEQANMDPRKIRAIGSHGQTIRHQPKGPYPFSLQIGDPNVIAARTGITTIADFRRRDIALGGHGAPLAPGFHAFFLQNPQQNNWVLNIGGIANLTWLPADKNDCIIGFDTGPGNCLLDEWCYLHTEQPYDRDGEWAASGQVNPELLMQLLTEPYLAEAPPKSTGRDLFNLDWLHQHMKQMPNPIPAQNVQATLVALTAQSIASHLTAKSAENVWVCGGGSRNPLLMQSIQSLCTSLKIKPIDECGIAAEWIEAVAFAWLAYQTFNHLPGNIPSVTGASQASILGGIYFV